jgi:4-amino-4-deoxy-L-arabinose transferase-like glycosyltransferase
MLIKGPIVYAFLLPGIVLVQCRGGRRGRYTAWCGWWPWILSLGIFLVWVVGGILFERGFFSQVVVREFLARFGETVHRPQPLLFYLPHLLHKFFPWSVLMIGLTVVELRSRRWKIRGVFREMSPETFWLVCWIFGGLVLMSIIPSKRVDRIFPIIPPLCLLLAAQLGNALQTSGACSRPLTDSHNGSTAPGPVATVNETASGQIFRWSALALAISILFTGGYAAFKIVSAQRAHRGALAGFGREVRDAIATHHWRYAVLKSRDEGLLPYLRATHFVRPDEAVTEWNRGNLDALVVPAKEAPALMRELHDAALFGLRSDARKDEPGRNYLLIAR